MLDRMVAGGEVKNRGGQKQKNSNTQHTFIKFRPLSKKFFWWTKIWIWCKRLCNFDGYLKFSMGFQRFRWDSDEIPKIPMGFQRFQWDSKDFEDSGEIPEIPKIPERFQRFQRFHRDSRDSSGIPKIPTKLTRDSKSYLPLALHNMHVIKAFYCHKIFV